MNQRRRQQPEWTESAIPPGGLHHSEVRGIDLVQGDEPHPDVVAMAADELENLLSSLDKEHAYFRLEAGGLQPPVKSPMGSESFATSSGKWR